jgi:tRNA (cmo5U34)-methyltransferase
VTVIDFSFAAHARGFDQHIRESIPGLECLRAMSIEFSRYFVQHKTNVIDIGCSSGILLRSIRDENEPSRRSVSYLGIDTERNFREHWHGRRAGNLRFQVRDARSFEGFENMSLVCSHFTLQFISERDRPVLLRRVYDGLNEGGALIIAEKVLAKSAKFQDMLTFPFYDHKLRSFSAEAILDKERSLRGKMTVVDEVRLEQMLCEAGFEAGAIQRIWQSYLFVAMIAIKTPRSPERTIQMTERAA